MLERSLAVLLSGCAVALAARDPENLKRSDVVTLDKVVIAGGEPRAGDGASGWKLRTTPQGVLIPLAPGERAGAWGGWYLNYDHKGTDPRVGLVPEPGPGCYWTWDEGPRKRKRDIDGFGYTIPCTARPAHGPLRGWALTLDGRKLVLAKKPAAEAGFTASIDDLNDGK
jgi:hypothetical protein